MRGPKTHCKRGHSLADAYIVRSAAGFTQRQCRQCKADAQRELHAYQRPEPLKPRSKYQPDPTDPAVVLFREELARRTAR